MDLKEYMNHLVLEARTEILAAKNIQELNVVKAKYLGKKSDINAILKAIWKGQTDA